MEDVLIIGAGTAGIGAAIYTARASLQTLVLGILEHSNAYKSHVFENYFGIDSITGPELMKRGKSQAEKFGARFVLREAVDIKANGDHTFTVKDTELGEYQAKYIIITSGLGFKPSGIKGEKEFTGRGVSFCVTCDGYFFKQKKVCIIGDSNFAAEEALELLTYTPDVTLLSHGKSFSINPKMEKAVLERGVKMVKSPKIQFFAGNGTVPPQLKKLTFIDGTNAEYEGAFIALGTAGAADFAMKLGLEYDRAYIKANPRTGETNVPGVYAAGDCTGGNAQAAKSVGEGCNAAISVIKSIKGVTAYVDY